MLPFCHLHALCNWASVQQSLYHTGSPFFLPLHPQSSCSVSLFLTQSQQVEDTRCFLAQTLRRPRRIQHSPSHSSHHPSPLKRNLPRPRQVISPKQPVFSTLQSTALSPMPPPPLDSQPVKMSLSPPAKICPSSPSLLALNLRHQVWLCSCPLHDQHRGSPFFQLHVALGGPPQGPGGVTVQLWKQGGTKLLSWLLTLCAPGDGPFPAP